MFSLICVWINGWVNNHEAGDLRRHRGHYDVNVMLQMTCFGTNDWVVENRCASDFQNCWLSTVNDGLPPQMSMTRCFDAFFDLRLNKRLSKQSRRLWFETPSRSLWRHCNEGRHVVDPRMCLLLINSLQWRHNGPDSVSNHQLHDCLLNRLFIRRSKKTSKPRVNWPLCGEFTGDGEFPAQMASYAEDVSIWWRHDVEGVDRVIPDRIWIPPSPTI